MEAIDEEFVDVFVSPDGLLHDTTVVNQLVNRIRVAADASAAIRQNFILDNSTPHGDGIVSDASILKPGIGWVTVHVTEGIRSGVHEWGIKIENQGETNDGSGMMLGLVPKSFSRYDSFISQGSGWCLSRAGKFYGHWRRVDNNNAVTSLVFGTGDRVHFELDYEAARMTVRVGDRFLVGELSNLSGEVYPAVSLHYRHQHVRYEFHKVRDKNAKGKNWIERNVLPGAPTLLSLRPEHLALLPSAPSTGDLLSGGALGVTTAAVPSSTAPSFGGSPTQQAPFSSPTGSASPLVAGSSPPGTPVPSAGASLLVVQPLGAPPPSATTTTSTTTAINTATGGGGASPSGGPQPGRTPLALAGSTAEGSGLGGGARGGSLMATAGPPGVSSGGGGVGVGVGVSVSAAGAAAAAAAAATTVRGWGPSRRSLEEENLESRLAVTSRAFDAVCRFVKSGVSHVMGTLPLGISLEIIRADSIGGSSLSSSSATTSMIFSSSPAAAASASPAAHMMLMGMAMPGYQGAAPTGFGAPRSFAVDCGSLLFIHVLSFLAALPGSGPGLVEASVGAVLTLLQQRYPRFALFDSTRSGISASVLHAARQELVKQFTAQDRPQHLPATSSSAAAALELLITLTVSRGRITEVLSTARMLLNSASSTDGDPTNDERATTDLAAAPLAVQFRPATVDWLHECCAMSTASKPFLAFQKSEIASSVVVDGKPTILSLGADNCAVFAHTTTDLRKLRSSGASVARCVASVALPAELVVGAEWSSIAVTDSSVLLSTNLMALADVVAVRFGKQSLQVQNVLRFTDVPDWPFRTRAASGEVAKGCGPEFKIFSNSPASILVVWVDPVEQGNSVTATASASAAARPGGVNAATGTATAAPGSTATLTATRSGPPVPPCRTWLIPALESGDVGLQQHQPQQHQQHNQQLHLDVLDATTFQRRSRVPLLGGLRLPLKRSQNCLQLHKDATVDFGSPFELLSTPSGHVTIEFWMQLLGKEEGHLIYQHGDKTINGEVFVETHVSDGLLCLRGGSRHDGRGVKVCSVSGPLPVGGAMPRWHHVALSFDGRWRLYLDGEPMVSVKPSTPHVAIERPKGRWSIGNGAIAKVCELRVWAGCRAARDIRSDFERSLSGAEPGLVLYCPMTHPISLIAYDYSPSARHGWVTRALEPVGVACADLPVQLFEGAAASVGAVGGAPVVVAPPEGVAQQQQLQQPMTAANAGRTLPLPSPSVRLALPPLSQLSWCLVGSEVLGFVAGGLVDTLGAAAKGGAAVPAPGARSTLCLPFSLHSGDFNGLAHFVPGSSKDSIVTAAAIVSTDTLSTTVWLAHGDPLQLCERRLPVAAVFSAEDDAAEAPAFATQMTSPQLGLALLSACFRASRVVAADANDTRMSAPLQTDLRRECIEQLVLLLREHYRPVQAGGGARRMAILRDAYSPRVVRHALALLFHHLSMTARLRLHPAALDLVSDVLPMNRFLLSSSPSLGSKLFGFLCDVLDDDVCGDPELQVWTARLMELGVPMFFHTATQRAELLKSLLRDDRGKRRQYEAVLRALLQNMTTVRSVASTYSGLDDLSELCVLVLRYLEQREDPCVEGVAMLAAAQLVLLSGLRDAAASATATGSAATTTPTTLTTSGVESKAQTNNPASSASSDADVTRLITGYYRAIARCASSLVGRRGEQVVTKAFVRSVLLNAVSIVPLIASTETCEPFMTLLSELLNGAFAIDRANGGGPPPFLPVPPPGSYSPADAAAPSVPPGMSGTPAPRRPPSGRPVNPSSTPHAAPAVASVFGSAPEDVQLFEMTRAGLQQTVGWVAVFMASAPTPPPRIVGLPTIFAGGLRLPPAAGVPTARDQLLSRRASSMNRSTEASEAGNGSNDETACTTLGTASCAAAAAALAAAADIEGASAAAADNDREPNSQAESASAGEEDPATNEWRALLRIGVAGGSPPSLVDDVLVATIQAVAVLAGWSSSMSAPVLPKPFARVTPGSPTVDFAPHMSEFIAAASTIRRRLVELKGSGVDGESRLRHIRSRSAFVRLFGPATSTDSSDEVIASLLHVGANTAAAVTTTARGDGSGVGVGGVMRPPRRLVFDDHHKAEDQNGRAAVDPSDSSVSSQPRRGAALWRIARERWPSWRVLRRRALATNRRSLAAIVDDVWEFVTAGGVFASTTLSSGTDGAAGAGSGGRVGGASSGDDSEASTTAGNNNNNNNGASGDTAGWGACRPSEVADVVVAARKAAFLRAKGLEFIQHNAANSPKDAAMELVAMFIRGASGKRHHYLDGIEGCGPDALRRVQGAALGIIRLLLTNGFGTAEPTGTATTSAPAVVAGSGGPTPSSRAFAAGANATSVAAGERGAGSLQNAQLCIGLLGGKWIAADFALLQSLRVPENLFQPLSLFDGDELKPAIVWRVQAPFAAGASSRGPSVSSPAVHGAAGSGAAGAEAGPQAPTSAGTPHRQPGGGGDILGAQTTPVRSATTAAGNNAPSSTPVSASAVGGPPPTTPIQQQQPQQRAQPPDATPIAGFTSGPGAATTHVPQQTPLLTSGTLFQGDMAANTWAVFRAVALRAVECAQESRVGSLAQEGCLRYLARCLAVVARELRLCVEQVQHFTGTSTGGGGAPTRAMPATAMPLMDVLSEHLLAVCNFVSSVLHGFPCEYQRVLSDCEAVGEIAASLACLVASLGSTAAASSGASSASARGPGGASIAELAMAVLSHLLPRVAPERVTGLPHPLLRPSILPAVSFIHGVAVGAFTIGESLVGALPRVAVRLLHNLFHRSPRWRLALAEWVVSCPRLSSVSGAVSTASSTGSTVPGLEDSRLLDMCLVFLAMVGHFPDGPRVGSVMRYSDDGDMRLSVPVVVIETASTTSRIINGNLATLHEDREVASDRLCDLAYGEAAVFNRCEGPSEWASAVRGSSSGLSEAALSVLPFIIEFVSELVNNWHTLNASALGSTVGCSAMKLLALYAADARACIPLTESGLLRRLQTTVANRLSVSPLPVVYLEECVSVLLANYVRAPGHVPTPALNRLEQLQLPHGVQEGGGTGHASGPSPSSSSSSLAGRTAAVGGSGGTSAGQVAMGAGVGVTRGAPAAAGTHGRSTTTVGLLPPPAPPLLGPSLASSPASFAPASAIAHRQCGSHVLLPHPSATLATRCCEADADTVSNGPSTILRCASGCFAIELLFAVRDASRCDVAPMPIVPVSWSSPPTAVDLVTLADDRGHTLATLRLRDGLLSFGGDSRAAATLKGARSEKPAEASSSRSPTAVSVTGDRGGATALENTQAPEELANDDLNDNENDNDDDDADEGDPVNEADNDRVGRGTTSSASRRRDKPTATARKTLGLPFRASCPLGRRDVGRWIHVIGVFDGDWHLYIDGELVATALGGNVEPLPTSISSITCGGSNSGTVDPSSPTSAISTAAATTAGAADGACSWIVLSGVRVFGEAIEKHFIKSVADIVVAEETLPMVCVPDFPAVLFRLQEGTGTVARSEGGGSVELLLSEGARWVTSDLPAIAAETDSRCIDDMERDADEPEFRSVRKEWSTQFAALDSAVVALTTVQCCASLSAHYARRAVLNAVRSSQGLHFAALIASSQTPTLTPAAIAPHLMDMYDTTLRTSIPAQCANLVRYGSRSSVDNADTRAICAVVRDFLRAQSGTTAGMFVERWVSQCLEVMRDCNETFVVEVPYQTYASSEPTLHPLFVSGGGSFTLTFDSSRSMDYLYVFADKAQKVHIAKYPDVQGAWPDLELTHNMWLFLKPSSANRSSPARIGLRLRSKRFVVAAALLATVMDFASEECKPCLPCVCSLPVLNALVGMAHVETAERRLSAIRLATNLLRIWALHPSVSRVDQSPLYFPLERLVAYGLAQARRELQHGIVVASPAQSYTRLVQNVVELLVQAILTEEAWRSVPFHRFTRHRAARIDRLYSLAYGLTDLASGPPGLRAASPPPPVHQPTAAATVNGPSGISGGGVIPFSGVAGSGASSTTPGRVSATATATPLTPTTAGATSASSANANSVVVPTRITGTGLGPTWRQRGKGLWFCTCDRGWHSVRGSVGMSRGRFYFEVRIPSASSVLCVGVITSNYRGSELAPLGVSPSLGQCAHSWSFDGSRLCRWHNNVRHDFSHRGKWKAGDVIGVLLDLEDGSLTCTHNGKLLGVAYENLSNSKTTTKVSYFPAVSFNPSGCEINFGGAPFLSDVPAGYLPFDRSCTRDTGVVPIHECLALISSAEAVSRGLPLPPFFDGLGAEHFNDVGPARSGPEEVGFCGLDGKPKVEQCTIRSGTTMCTAKATVAVTAGKWYYEVLVHSDGMMQVGWCTSSFVPDSARSRGVGDDVHSWGIDGCRMLARHNKQQRSLGRHPWREGDVVGCLLDGDAGSIGFTINGLPLRELHDASASTSLFEGVPMASGVSPSVSLDPDNAATVVFAADKLSFLPEGYTGIGVSNPLRIALEKFYNNFEDTNGSSSSGHSASTAATTATTPTPATARAASGHATAPTALSDHRLVVAISQVVDPGCVLTPSETWKSIVARHGHAIAAMAPMEDGSRPSPEFLLERSVLLFRFATLVQLVRPFVPLIPADYNDGLEGPLMRAVRASKGVLHSFVAHAALSSCVSMSNGSGEPLKLTINRRKALGSPALTLNASHHGLTHGSGGPTGVAGGAASAVASPSGNGSSSSSRAMGGGGNGRSGGGGHDSLRPLHGVSTSNFGTSIFGQIFSLIGEKPASLFCTSRKLWSVVFAGEGADDVGGPYRESLAEMCAELMSSDALGMFHPSPNNQSNTAEFRDRFVPLPLRRDPNEAAQALAWYYFLGKVMGGCLRSGEPLALYFPSLVWKRLLGEEPDARDLDAIDASTGRALQYFRSLRDRGATDEELSDAYEGGFTTVESDGRLSELFPSGASLPVTIRTLGVYGQAVERHRLSVEGADAIEAMRRGFHRVVPSHALWLLRWEDLERVVCGRADFDVSELRSSVRYEPPLTPDDRRVRFLWQVLAEFSRHERALFMRFVSGRERLPPSVKLKLMPAVVMDGTDDSHLPGASTCFFWLSLPDYSSVSVLREKLLYAIHNCIDIDADFNVREDEEDSQVPRAVHAEEDDDADFEDYSHLL